MLVQIRDSLTQLKLVRQPGVTMFEDHLAAVFETMRVLITGLGQPNAFAFDVQREFFRAISIRGSMLAAMQYRRNPLLITTCELHNSLDSFMAVERDSFAMDQ